MCTAKSVPCKKTLETFIQNIYKFCGWSQTRLTPNCTFLHLWEPETVCAHEHMAKILLFFWRGNYVQSFGSPSPATRTWTLAAFSQPSSAAPAGSTGACERSPRWLHRWDRCSSGGRDRWFCPRRISACATSTPPESPRSACRSGSSRGNYCWCPTGCWPSSSLRRIWGPRRVGGTRPGRGPTVPPAPALAPARGLRAPRRAGRTAAPGTWPGSCSRATCRRSPRRRGGSSPGPRLLSAALSYLEFAKFARVRV